MQPEPTFISETDLIQDSTVTTERSLAQYGTHTITLPPDLASSSVFSDDQVGRAVRDEVGPGGDIPTTPPSDAVSVSSQGSRSPSLSRNAFTSPQPVRNRIDEYEKAGTPPVRRREGPGFEIIKRQRSPDDKSSPLQDLPNEVLIHALAHLGPADLTSIALVSKRFHSLVTGPHAWRSAFGHYFPGLLPADAGSDVSEDEGTGRRVFTRLTPIASWRSEYIMRTRLLRSLARGKPSQQVSPKMPSRSGQPHFANPVVDYNAQLFTTINHLHARFSGSQNKRSVRFVHGADESGMATSSDPNTGKIDDWGISDPQQFVQFVDRYPGDSQYGLGSGALVGVPNVMDVSEPYGMVYGEGGPAGLLYFRSTEEKRGRLLIVSTGFHAPELGIPLMPLASAATTAVWIAKSAAIPSLTDGSIGMLTATSQGVLTAHSLGLTAKGNSRERRFTRGEMTARWVLCPGVPIIAIVVDNEYSLKRQAENRIWAVALNALGEIFYLTKFPSRIPGERGNGTDDEMTERLAWLAGRTVYWRIVESSRREAKLDPYFTTQVDGSYSPRSSWNGMCLAKEQLQAESREIEEFFSRKPIMFRKTCMGWDMRRRLMVDFANDDGNHAGESVIVIECGLEEECEAVVKRHMRFRFQDRADAAWDVSTPPMTRGSTYASNSPSIFSGSPSPAIDPIADAPNERFGDSLASEEFGGTLTPRPMTEEWRTTEFSFLGQRNIKILATALDDSIIATQTKSEDPLLTFSARSTTSSPISTPFSTGALESNSAGIPGSRARFFAVGTQTGNILLWNIRAAPPRSTSISNTVEPVRVVHTDSPQISCLALSSLYLVHGGNDGLVQAWDPLGSSNQPIRTLHSRFSSRARRRLVQAEVSAQGVGINLFAAGSICLDPDPTVLRGVVSLGTRIRYWSYSSSAADQYKSHKRRLRRGERGSNNGGTQFGAVRTNLKDYIANERHELDRERNQRRKEAQRFAGRFGTELLNGSEEEMMAYAAMLSHEAFATENLRRASDSSVIASGTEQSVQGSRYLTPSQTSSPPLSTTHDEKEGEEELDADLAEAIRQSLESPATVYDIPLRQAKPKAKRASSSYASPRPSPMLTGTSRDQELSDLEFALQLSMAEEHSKQGQTTSEEFPPLASPIRQYVGDKGKGRVP